MEKFLTLVGKIKLKKIMSGKSRVARKDKWKPIKALSQASPQLLN